MGIMDSVKGAMGGDNQGLADKAKDLVNEHEEQVDAGIDRAGDAIDDKTGGRFSGQVDKGQSFLQDKTGTL